MTVPTTQTALFSLAMVMAIVANSFAEQTVSLKTPNIVLILADDMGAGEPAHAGGLIPTPALDRLASEGMRFTDAHTSSSVCTPTRYGILTGRYNWRSRLKAGVLTAVDSPALMDPNRLSLPRYMQKNGYHTACIGKWHLGVDWVKSKNTKPANTPNKDFGSWSVDYTQPFKNGPIDHGFNEAFFILSSLDMPPYTYLRNDRVVTAPTVNRGFPHNEYNDYQRVGAAAEHFDPSDCLADWASEARSYIRSRTQREIETQHDIETQPDPANHGESQKPFFLYLSLTSPHTPVVPGKNFKGRYPEYSWYADFLAETDWVVEQVLEQLTESGIDQETLVIFTSDNGFAPYVEIPKMLDAGYRPSGHYRGAKASAYEGGHRVPFLVRWPGKVQAGSDSKVTVCTTDFFATFADIIGEKARLPNNAAEDSFSFYPCLNGDHGPTRPFTVHHSISGKFAIRKGEWKLILSQDGGGGWGSLPWELGLTTPSKLVQLYNLKNDIGETENLEDNHPEIVRELINDLAKAMHDGRTTPGENQTNEGWPYRHKPTMKRFPQLTPVGMVEPSKQ